jgi:hypothetical protein
MNALTLQDFGVAAFFRPVRFQPEGAPHKVAAGGFQCGSRSEQKVLRPTDRAAAGNLIPDADLLNRTSQSGEFFDLRLSFFPFAGGSLPLQAEAGEPRLSEFL